MADDREQRLQRARLALEGLSVGDALGGFFEFNPRASTTYATARKVPDVSVWRWTDDTNMALSIYENLRVHHTVNQDALAHSFGTHYDRARGYGRSMHKMLPKLAQGEDWRAYNLSLFPGGSFGNGGPMKIAPLGAYLADDMDLLVAQVESATVVTHAHPESVAGATAAAVAAALA